MTKTGDESAKLPDASAEHRVARRERLQAATIGVSNALSQHSTPPVEGAVRGSTAHFLPPRTSFSGRFETLDELGRGGMGLVLQALDRELGRVVAIKVMREQGVDDPVLTERFLNEARLTAQLDHPNIVPVHELGVSEGGELFFVMKRVKGRSMRELIDALREGEEGLRWALHRRLADFVQVCNAIAFAHQRGVLHRDLKPDNVMIGDWGEVLVMDWGVARVIEATDEAASAAPLSTGERRIVSSSVGQTLQGSTVGTPGYMSPEQILGDERRLSPKSDVWSLGAILYELLTLQPLFEASSVQHLMLLTVSTPAPSAAAQRTPKRIPEELDQICSRALSSDPEQRYSAQDLGRALQSYLEGSARHEEAQARAADAQRAWEEHSALLEERARLEQRLEALERTTPPWTPLEQKAEVLSVRAGLHETNVRLEEVNERVVSACERALSHDPQHNRAHDLLADVYWSRLQDADLRGDAIAARHYANRVRAHDNGRYVALLDRSGPLSLSTSPTHADVYCRRIERSGLVWSLHPPVYLGRTPLQQVQLAMGSYLLSIEAPGYRATLYPVHIFRGKHWEAADVPLRLYSDEEIGEDWCYVPSGPFVCGGDPQANAASRRSEPRVGAFFISRFPVRCSEYCMFLNALHIVDAEQAWRRVPREVSGQHSASGQYWFRPSASEQYFVPTSDRDGVRWDPESPVSSISWDDANAYAAWKSQVSGIAHRLPRELEWEKAARGVDGRVFPWGDEFDPSLCLMRDSRPVNVSPEPVGSFSYDCSVYGVADLAGGVSDWCVESSYLGDTRRRIARGGSFSSEPRACRVASKLILDASFAYTSVGFRLVRGAPLLSKR
ncbi:MAG: bifunctional serine/threonine-protein kinase/formylglycine-generating enzyme family protein [Myxococcota bacterium]|jgi:serine/threonine-protein kinase|nr:bifunctional serine/threonine-protein kinase/formylglycine-generating enzyme family protein [Myxococcota bacterium]